MHVALEQSYPAPVEKIYEYFTNRDFLNEVSTAAGAASSSVDISTTPATADHGVKVITTSNVQVKVPAQAARFVGPEVTMVQTTSWGQPENGARTADLTIDVRRQPVTVKGTLLLRPTATGCELIIDGDFTIKIPLVGPRLEQAAEPTVLRTLNKQRDVALQWLADGR